MLALSVTAKQAARQGCLPVYLTVRLAVCLTVRLAVCLTVRLAVYLACHAAPGEGLELDSYTQHASME